MSFSVKILTSLTDWLQLSLLSFHSPVSSLDVDTSRSHVISSKGLITITARSGQPGGRKDTDRSSPVIY